MRYFTFSLRRILTLAALSVCGLSLFVAHAAYTRNDGVSQTWPSARAATTGSQSLPPAKQLGPRLAYLPKAQPVSNALMSSFSAAPAGLFFVPMVTATKTASLGNDVNSNGFVNPGDTLMYSVVVSNSGTDAMSVVFTDQLNANLTLMGTATASPIATNDSYTSIGNVGITVPAGSGLLANDVSPDNTSVSVTAVNTAGTQGTVTFNPNGSFTFMPVAGFEGTTTFGYTLTSSNTKTDTGTVTITVSGMIWFIDNSSANGDGRLGTPFSSIANFNTGASDDPGDNIFVYRQIASNYTGSSLTLLANQKLIGQGATASLATITGISVPTFSNALPATSGTRPVLTNTNTNVTLSTGNTIRGVDLQNTTAGSALLGTSFNNLTISETTASSTNATAAVNLDQASATAAINVTFISVSANNCSNGIVLADTTGSFSVNGDDSNTSLGGNNSGGVISNTSGADEAVAGNGVYLSNVQSVSLRRMQINDHPNWAIRGLSVNGFNLEYATVNSTASGTSKNGNNAAFDEGSIYFGIENPGGTNGLTGTATVTNCIIEDGFENNFKIANLSGTLSQFTMTGTTIRDTSVASPGNNGFEFRADGTANITADISTSTFTGNRANGIQVSSVETSTGTIDVEIGVAGIAGSGGTFTNNNIGVNIAHGGQGTMNFDVHRGTFNSNPGLASPININMAGSPTGTGPMNGFITNNLITNANSLTGPGIRVTTNGTDGDGSNVLTIQVSNNNISQIGNRGIEMIARDGNSDIIATVTNNTVQLTDPLSADGIRIDAGAVSTDTTSICANISGNNSDTVAGVFGIRIRQRFAGTIYRLPGYAGLGTDDIAVQNFLAANNPLSTGFSADHASATGFGAGAACATPPAMAPVETDEQLKQQSGNTAQSAVGNRAQPGFFAQVRQWLNPVFSAFTAPLGYVKLDRAFSKAAEAFVPAVTAAEKPEDTGNGSGRAPAAVPAKTMIVNSRGETRIVPTASLAAMAGELVTINGAGSGFTLPAGESTTIMFNATISSSFTGTAITNQASVSGTGFGPVLSNNLSTPVIQAPNFSKAFSPTTIATTTGVSALTFTLVNPNPSQVLTAVAFTDSLPAGVEVANPPTISTAGCGSPTFAPAATATTLNFSGGSIGASGTCTVSVNVRSTTEGAKLNTSSTATSTQANPSGTASATLNVINAPTFTKAFGASTIPLNGTTSLTFTITNNSAAFPLNGVGFTDTLPAGLIVDTPSGLSTTCDGSVSASPGGGSVTWSGGSLVATASCTISLNVKGTTTGAKNNSATLATTELGANSAATGTVTLTVLAPPTISKAFSPTSIFIGGTSSQLTFTISNPNASGTLTGVGFSDVFPSGLEVDATPGVAVTNCGGSTNTSSFTAGATTLNVTNASVTAGTPCTIKVNVIGTTAGVKNNTTGAITSTEGGTGTTSNTATLNVFTAPQIVKSFGASAISLNGTTTLTFTITNPAANPGALTTITFIDSLPSGLVVVNPPVPTNSCGGSVTAVNGSGTISLGGASIVTPGNTCQVQATVMGTTSGVKNNSVTVSSGNGGTGNTSNASLSVASPPAVTKSFSPASIPLNGTSTLTVNFTNPNAFALSGLAISDAFPAGMEVAAIPAATNTCGGVFAPVAGNTSISLSGGSLTSSGSCSVSVAVKGTTAGAKNNTTGNVSTTESGAGSTASATLTVVDPPAFTKSFGPASIPLGAISTLTFTITNNNTTSALNGIAFTDILPAGMSVSDATTNNVCGAGSTLTVTAATRTISLTGGNLAVGSPAPTTCTIPVTVTGIATGAHLNTTQAITSTEGGTGGSASATLSVFAPPTVTKAFSPTGVQIGGTSTLTITITNPAGNPAGVTGVAISDSFPAGMEVNTTPGATNTCGGTFSPAAMATSISLTGGAIAAAGGSCSISVIVKGTTAGSKLNTTGMVSSTEGGAGLTASATLTVAAPPTVTKSFSPTSIPLNGTSTLTLNFSNSNAFALSGLAISDNFPAGVEVAAVPAATNSCGGTFAPAAAATSISLSGGTLTGSGSCSITVAVKGTTAGAKLNTTGNVSTTESGAGGTANATLNVFAPPTVAKVFVPTSVQLNGQSTLSIVITNPAGNPGGLSGIAISDTFPAGLEVSSPLVSSNSCGGTFAPTAGGTSISLTGGAIATAGNNCTISVNVRGTTVGAKANTTGAVSSTEGGTGLTASATLNVFAPPTITKAFSPATIAPNGTSTLTITITNPAANPAGVTGVAVSDTFPAGMEVNTTPGATNTCGGTFTPVAAATSISLTGGTIATAGGSCAISVVVKGTTAGPKLNTTGTVSSTEGGTGLTASATLTVAAPPTVTKSFSPTSIPLNGTSTLTLNFSNSNAFALSGLAISDNFPAGVEVAAVPAATNTCGGTFAPAAAATSISLSGGTLTGSGSCSITVAVKGTTAGAKLNTTGNVSTTESGAGGTANATLNVFAPPTITKAFSPTGVALNGTSTLTITITNPAANPAGVTGIAVSDSFPAGMEVNTAPGATNTCGGTFSPAAAATSIALSGGAIATAGGSCAISVVVKGTTAGAKANTTGTVSSTEGGTGLTASATLNVVAPPAISKAFSPVNVPVGQTSTLTFTITNPAANTVALMGVGFTDAFPNAPNLIVANPTGATLTGCGAATLTDNLGGALAPGDLGIMLSGATVGVGGTCTVTVNVTPQANATYNNVSGNVSSTNGGTGNTASATLQTIQPPTISKAFGAATIPLNGSTSLSFTIANPNASVPLSGISFTDSLPAGLVVSTPNGLTGSCGGGTITAAAGSGSVSLSGATLAASSNCTFSVNVTGTTGGVKNNVTGNITATESGSGSTASATVTVVPPPTIAKAFSAATIQLNGSTTLTFTLANPSATVAQNAVAFIDTLPAGLVVATPNGLVGACGGTMTAVAGSGSISLTGGTIAAGGNCIIGVNVTGTTAGVKNNVTGTVSSTEGGTGLTASATLNVVAPPAAAKAFAPASVAVNGVSTLTITLTNPSSNTVALTGVAITDNFPAGMEVDATPGATNTCGGTFAPVAAATSISLTGGTIPANGNCAISVKVKGTTSGVKTNTTNAVTSTNGGTGNTATATLTVASPPVLTAAVGNANIFLNTSTTLSYTIMNPNAITLTGVAFSATLPAGLVIDTSVVARPGSNTCSGTFTAANGASSLSLSNGVVAANSSCTVAVGVKGTTPGLKTITSSTVTTNESGPGAAATTALTVHPGSVVINDPVACLGPGSTVEVVATVTNASAGTLPVNFTSVPSANLLALVGSCTSSLGTCTVVNNTLVTWSGNLNANQTVTIRYQAQVADNVGAGAQVCTTSNASFNGGPFTTLQYCTTVNCPREIGAPYPADSATSDQKAGSVLVYNYYTSSSSTPHRENTRVSITNVDLSRSTYVHLFFVDGSSCSVADAFICLTPNQTASWLMSDLDPGVSGYLIAVAVDASGCPTTFNKLIGDEFIKTSTGHSANLLAQAFASLPGGPLSCDANSNAATLRFDGVSYNRAPRVLALNNLASPDDGSSALLVVNRFGGSLVNNASTIGAIFGVLYDDAEKAYSFSVTSGACQFRQTLSNSFPRTTPRLGAVIPAGRSGWLKFYSNDDIGLLGAVLQSSLNNNPGIPDQGRNLHTLTHTSNATLTIPVFPPSCR